MENVTTENDKNGAITLSHINFSRYVGCDVRIFSRTHINQSINTIY